MIITHSSLDCFKSCRRKYKLRYLDGIVSKQKSESLEFGSRMHELLEQYLNHIKAVQAFNGDLDDGKALEAIEEKVIANMEASPVDSAKLLGLIRGYIRKYYNADATEYDVHFVEKEFNLTTPYSDTDLKLIRIAGKVDGVVQSKDDQRFFIVEHKTASNVDDAYVAQKDIDSQTMMYALCLEQSLGIQVSGVIHDIIIKQKIRQKKGESEEEFCDRLINDVTDENFIRIVVDIDRDRLNEFKDEFDASCSDLSQCRNFYKCTGNCLGRFGACDYLALCRAGGLVDSVRDLYEKRREHEELSVGIINQGGNNE